MTYPKAAFLSGLIWMAVGYLLLSKGLFFLSQLASLHPVGFQSDFLKVLPIEYRIQFILIMGVWMGFMKGNFVLKKTAKRVLQHMVMQEEPLKFKTMYPKSYLILLGIMMLLGMSMRFIPLSIDIKAIVDITVGAALIIGSWHYFKKAYQLTKALKNL
jgi:hypothetical protein